MDPKSSTVHSKANKASQYRAMVSIKGLTKDLEQELKEMHIEEKITPSQKALRSFLKGMYDRLALQNHQTPYMALILNDFLLL